MIEKNIFQTWCNKTLHPKIQNQINKIKQLNPTFKYQLFDDNEIDNFVNENFKGDISNAYNKLNIIVAKTDFWRYLVLYKYGGVYLDMDSSIEKPLNELIKDEDQAIITAEGNPNVYVQWCLMFQKEHPILKATIDIIVDNINNNTYPNDILKMTGPIAYTMAIDKVHFSLFRNIITHKEIKKDTDITYHNQYHNVSYRLYSIDYGMYANFKYNDSMYLYINKKPWRQEQKEKQLLK